MKNARSLLRFLSSSLEPAWHHQRFRLTGLGCADRGKTCPLNKWFRLLELSCNVVQNNSSFLVFFSLLFDLIKNSCYLLSMWLCYSPFIIYILITFSSISLNRLHASSLQADSVLPLPAREINERKQTIIRELQLFFVIKPVLKTFLFCFLDSSQTGTKKRTKETPWSPLFTTVTPRFARA